MSSIDEQFVEFIVKSLVSNPDAVQVDRSVDEKGVLLELTVDPEDLGRVIGKRGATAQSLRTLLRALGTKNDARYNLKIVDNGPEDRVKPAPASKDNTDDDSADDQVAAEDALNQDTPASTLADEDEEEANEGQSDLAAKTRRELADLDDLDL